MPPAVSRQPEERMPIAGPIVDAWFNVNAAGVPDEFWGGANGAVVSQFHRQRELLSRGESRHDLIALMDRLGIARALISAFPVGELARFDVEVALLADLCASYPDRFGAAPYLPLEMGMPAARAVTWAARDLGAVAVRVMPARVGLPPTHRSYYPAYTKCIDEGLPITINVGLPGPALPAETQRPLELDQVCRDFPEMVVVATHMGWPWHNELIGLALRHPNLYVMTSAWAPRHYPAEMVDFIRGRGRGRVMFASVHPLVDAARCLAELAEFGLTGDAAEDYLHRVADRLFFARRGAAVAR
jgi:predicted TIM-barrel fold metal-dependent hydrolase